MRRPPKQAPSTAQVRASANPSAGEPEFFSTQILEARRFCLGLGPRRGERLAVLCGGLERCAPDYKIHRRTFPYWSIEFVAQGRGQVTLRGRGQSLEAGMVFSYGPGITHDIECDAQRPLVKYFVDFAGREARELLRRHGPAPGECLRTGAPSAVLALFESLISAARRRTSVSARVSALSLEQLILTIGESSNPSNETDSQGRATYTRCRSHIEDQWVRLVSLDQVARECGVTSAYLCGLFRRFDRISPYQHLLGCRIRGAAERLLDPAASIKEVATELGFSSTFHFSRVFKRLIGMPPGRFVQLHRRS